MSEQNIKSANSQVALQFKELPRDLQLRKTTRHMIWNRLLRRPGHYTVPVAMQSGNGQLSELAYWLFNEASPSELRAVAKAIEKYEQDFEKKKSGDFDLRIAREAYLEARAGKRDKRPTLADVRYQVLRNCEKYEFVFGDGKEMERVYSLGKDSQKFNLIDRTLRKKLKLLRKYFCNVEKLLPKERRKELGGFALRTDKCRRPKGAGLNSVKRQ